MGNHEPYWNTCIVKIWLTFFEFEEEMFQILIGWYKKEGSQMPRHIKKIIF